MTPIEPGYTSFKISVPAAFEDVFTHFYIAENNTGQPVSKTLLPSYQTILIFSFGTSISLLTKQHTNIEIEKCLLLGPIKQAFEYTLPAGAAILVANFKNDAFYRFFGDVLLSEPLPVHPDKLLAENCFTTLWYALKEMNTAIERTDFILAFSKPYLSNQSALSEKLIHFRDEAYSSIKAIAEQTNQSERNIQLHHKKYFGYSAKEVNRYHRFLKAIEQIQIIAENKRRIDWFEVIHHCGYYDQSQLIHDFKHFINLSPNQFLKFQQDVCIAQPE